MSMAAMMARAHFAKAARAEILGHFRLARLLAHSDFPWIEAEKFKHTSSFSVSLDRSLQPINTGETTHIFPKGKNIHYHIYGNHLKGKKNGIWVESVRHPSLFDSNGLPTDVYQLPSGIHVHCDKEHSMCEWIDKLMHFENKKIDNKSGFHKPRESKTLFMPWRIDHMAAFFDTCREARRKNKDCDWTDYRRLAIVPGLIEGITFITCYANGEIVNFYVECGPFDNMKGTQYEHPSYRGWMFHPGQLQNFTEAHPHDLMADLLYFDPLKETKEFTHPGFHSDTIKWRVWPKVLKKNGSWLKGGTDTRNSLSQIAPCPEGNRTKAL